MGGWLAATTEKDAEEKGGRTMGCKHIVPYGLYRAYAYISAPLASHGTKGAGFSEDGPKLPDSRTPLQAHRVASRVEAWIPELGPVPGTY